MNKLNKGIRKVLVAALGFPLLVVGIILIPLPGPGLVVCAAALLLLSSEFSWAERHYLTAKRAVMKIIDDTKAKQQKILEAEDKNNRDK